MHSTSFFKRRLACAPPAGNTCDQTLLRLLRCAAAWGQAPTRKAKKKKKLPPKRQDSQVSLESPAAFSRPPPTSSTGLWQTRSERKPWNQRRKPREAYHQRGSAYEPEQQLASSCHVAATSQCMPVRAFRSQRQLTFRVALARQENISVPPPEAHSWAHDKPQHSSAQPCKRSVCQKYML